MSENLPPVVPVKKGLPTLAWAGIGCATLIILVVLIVVGLLVARCRRAVGEFSKNPEKAAAEMMVRLNPELSKVSQDDAKGEMTIRTKDGEEMTLSYKEISEGKFAFKDKDGNVTQIGDADLSKLPPWVPRVPGADRANSATQSQTEGKLSGMYVVSTSQSVDELDKFFTAEAAKNDFTESSRTSFSADGTSNHMLSFESGTRNLQIVITGKPGEDTQVNVGYQEEAE